MENFLNYLMNWIQEKTIVLLDMFKILQPSLHNLPKGMRNMEMIGLKLLNYPLLNLNWMKQ